MTNQTVNGGSCEPQSVNLTGLQVYTNYTISVRVTIAEFDVNSLLIVDLWSVTSEEGELNFNVLMMNNVIHIIMYCFVVPLSPPQNVNAPSYTPNSITVCFELSEGSIQNGQINVILVGSPFDTESQTVSIPVTFTDYPFAGSICGNITNLQEYNNYTIVIVLENSAGSGPNSTSINVRTLETGNYNISYIEE